MFRLQVWSVLKRLTWTLFIGHAVFRLFLIFNHHHSLLQNDSKTCYQQLLRNKGRWKSDTIWQPQGCNLIPPTASCLDQVRQERIVIIGDSTARLLFQAFAKIIYDTNVESNTDNKHEHQSMANGQLVFIWDPFLNKTLSTLESGLYDNKLSCQMSDRVVIRAGLWPLKYGQKNWKIDIFDNLISKLDSSHFDHPWIVGGPGVVNPELLSPERQLSLQPLKILELQKSISDSLENTKSATSWTSINDMTLKSSTFQKSSDGLHPPSLVSTTSAQSILQLWCHLQNLPTDQNGACCTKRGHFYTKEVGLFIVWFVSGPLILLWTRIYRNTMNEKNLKTVYAWTQFGLVLYVAYICDRTVLFDREQKVYDSNQFVSLVAMGLFIGLMTLKAASSNPCLPSNMTADSSPAFLHRLQTDEWKGWMQYVILIYHYTRASTISPIYNWIRVLVGAYLFMTGYGHVSFYLSRHDFGGRRVVQVLLRLNLIAIGLAMIMDSDYVKYYFSPLVSVWYVVIYICMRVGKNWNEWKWGVPLKIGLFAIIIHFIILSPDADNASLPQPWFQWLWSGTVKILNAEHWSLKEWYFRLWLDSFAVFAGGMVAVWQKSIHSSSQKNQEDGDSVKTALLQKYGIDNVYKLLPMLSRPFSNSLQDFMSMVFWSILLLSYSVFFTQNMDKYTYNKVHVYFSIIPIIAYAMLRNASPLFRRYTSTAFAYLGQISLETFLLQFHIWLAADTQALLVIWPWPDVTLFSWSETSFWINFVFVSIHFLDLCDMSASATGILVDFLAGSKVSLKDICIRLGGLIVVLYIYIWLP